MKKTYFVVYEVVKKDDGELLEFFNGFTDDIHSVNLIRKKILRQNPKANIIVKKERFEKNENASI